MTLAADAAAPAELRTYVRQVVRHVWADRFLYAVIGLYAVAVAISAIVLGAPDKLGYFAYARPWLQVLTAVVLGAYVITELPASIRANPASPLERMKARAPQIFNPRVAAGFLLVLGLVVTQGTFTSAKNLLPLLVDFHWDAPLADLDKSLHGGRDPWVWLQPVMGHHVVTRTIQMLYTGGWLVALCGVTFAVAASRRLAHLRLRFFLTYLFAWIVLGNLAAGWFMSAGPVYFGHVTGDDARFASQMSYLSFSEGALHSSFDIQRDLWTIHQSGRAELGSGISAFPSLHIAMATLFFWTGCSINWRLGLAAAAFLLVILMGSVHLAWHYAVDGYFSFIAVTLVWCGIGLLQRALAKRAARA